MNTHKQTQTHTKEYLHPHTATHRHTHRRTHTHTQTHTHTHTHTLSLTHTHPHTAIISGDKVDGTAIERRFSHTASGLIGHHHPSARCYHSARVGDSCLCPEQNT